MEELTILLDGVEQQNVADYSVDEGWVCCVIEFDKVAGNHVLSTRFGEVKTEARHG